MSQREATRRKMARTVFLKAWWFLKRINLISFSVALKLAWKTVRSMAHFNYSKVRGVSFGNRQALLKKLAGYAPDNIFLTFIREPGNPADSNAIQIVAQVRTKGQAVIGYLAKDIAALIAPILDSGKEIAVVQFCGISGTTGNNGNLGCNFCYTLL